MKIKIISARQNDGGEISAQQIKQDMPELERIHEKYLLEDATWNIFGGVIRIDDRVYQVMSFAHPYD